jgi:Tfp pilus assembly protein PilF
MSIRPRIEQIKSMLQNEPEDAFLQYALATEYVAGEQLNEGREVFEKLVEAQPDYVATYYHLGKLYETISEREKAEATYETGIEIAVKIKDLHAKSELQDALNNLLFDE